MFSASPSSHFYMFQHMGAVFPQRSERSAPVFTPPQTQPLSSYPQNLRNPELGQQAAAESSAEAEFPTLRYITRLLFVLPKMLTLVSCFQVTSIVSLSVLFT